MAASSSYSMRIVQGETFRLDMRISSRNGRVISAIDISGDSFELFSVDAYKRSWVTITSAGGEITIVDGPAGRLRLEMSDEATAALRPGAGRFDLFWLRSDGDRVRVLTGELTVEDTAEAV